MVPEPVEPLTIPLEQPLLDFVREQAVAAGYSSPSDYVGHLIRTARRHESQLRLEAALVKGLQSGTPSPMTDDDWEQLRQFARERMAISRGSE